MIRFENVTKRYPDGTVAVDDLSLTAPTGKITVFVGPSGCGKTTSLRMINRMIEPTAGTIWLGDTDTASMQTHVLRRQIGYVIQHAGLFPHRTIIDNVTTVPVLLGAGRRLFGPLAADVALDLTDSRAYANGLVQSRYKVRHGAGEAAAAGGAPGRGPGHG